MPMTCQVVRKDEIQVDVELKESFGRAVDTSTVSHHGRRRLDGEAALE